MNKYSAGFGLPQKAIFDNDRAKRLLAEKWFFVGTRGDVPTPRAFFNFQLFDEQYFLLHGTDGVIRCMVNRCSHQSARLLKNDRRSVGAYYDSIIGKHIPTPTNAMPLLVSN
jgi:hypothetical protein